MIITTCFGLSAILLIISLSLKTLLLTLKVALKTAETAGRTVIGAGKRVGSSVVQRVTGGDGEVSQLARGAQRTTQAVTNVARTGVNAVKTTGRAAATTGKAAVKTGKVATKVGKVAGKVGVKAIKLTIRAVELAIRVIQSVVTCLLSLGVVGIIVLVVVVIFVIAAVAGAIVAASPTGSASFYGGTLGGTTAYVTTPTGVTSTTPATTGGEVAVPKDTSSLVASCKTMADWYLANVSTYQCSPAGTKGTGTRQYYTCSLVGFGVGDDCTGFSAAYASLVSGKKVNADNSRAMYLKSSSYESAGWTYYTVEQIGGTSGLQPGDILVCSEKADSGSKGGHAEVYLGPGQSFGWGQVQSKYPSNTGTLTDRNGYIVDSAGTHYYGRVYRYTGG